MGQERFNKESKIGDGPAISACWTGVPFLGMSEVLGDGSAPEMARVKLTGPQDDGVAGGADLVRGQGGISGGMPGLDEVWVEGG